MSVTKQRGLYKQKIKTVLFKSDALNSILIGEVERTSDKIKAINKVIKTHLFIDDTITEPGSYIYYDVVIPEVNNQTKECNIYLYAICHRDILDEPLNMENYYGNRADVLAQLVEETLLDKSNRNQFGIGKLDLNSLDIYNSTNFYGVQMIFSTHDFN